MLIETDGPTLLTIWHNGTEFVIARSAKEAREEIMMITGLNFKEAEGDGWFDYELDDIVQWRDEHDVTHPRLVSDLVRENGAGYLGSTEA